MTEEKRYFNRELSWLDFNARVLAEVGREKNPLLERLKFAGIVSSNFDEFFMVRVASLSENDEATEEVYEKAFRFMKDLENIFSDQLAPALEKENIRRIPAHGLKTEQREFIENLYWTEIKPLLTPIALHEDKPIPMLVNLSLYCMFELIAPEKADVKRYAVVEVPSNYPRIISLPAGEGYSFVLLEDVIAMFAKDLFTGYEICHSGFFRLTRGAEMSLDEEKDEDFSKVMQEALQSRLRGYVVRLELNNGSPDMAHFLKACLKISERVVYETSDWMDLKEISQLAFQLPYENLKRKTWHPVSVPEFEESAEIWNILKERDILVHHPYESFDALVRFLNEAANDPDVLAIKQTLYRAGSNSKVVSCLERAANQGKRVTVLVELKARFDEEKNIEWAKRLEDAGATVLYGVVGLKTHAKVCLIVRREPDGIKRYVHLGTGNYNEKTAKIYSDLGLFTADDDMTSDCASFFNVITGFSSPSSFSKISIAPFTLRQKIERLILREGMKSEPEKPGLIIAKMNSLVDEGIINALYAASGKGVRIKLNIRGICCLVPGIKGMSENIEVLSIVDQFLEHSRIFYFQNGGDEEIYLSSADWMPRNLNRRLEILFPAEDENVKKDLKEIVGSYFKDNTHAWQLHSDGEYKPVEAAQKSFRVQKHWCEKAQQKASQKAKAAFAELKPQRPKSQNDEEIRASGDSHHPSNP